MRAFSNVFTICKMKKEPKTKKTYKYTEQHQISDAELVEKYAVRDIDELTGSKFILRLFHGRDIPEEELDDWGQEGPVFLIDTFHWTYGFPHAEIIDPRQENEMVYFSFRVVEDMILFNDVYYGDFIIDNI